MSVAPPDEGEYALQDKECQDGHCGKEEKAEEGGKPADADGHVDGGTKFLPVGAQKGDAHGHGLAGGQVDRNVDVEGSLGGDGDGAGGGEFLAGTGAVPVTVALQGVDSDSDVCWKFVAGDEDEVGVGGGEGVDAGRFDEGDGATHGLASECNAAGVGGGVAEHWGGG